MTLKVGARILLTLGFLAASVSYSSWVLHRTALDPAATRSATHALIAAPSVRSALARQLHDTLAPELGRVAAADPKLRTAVNAAVADPRFVGAFADAIAEIHTSILSDHGGPVTLDTRAVTASLRAAMVHHDPALAQKVRTLGNVRLPLGGDSKLPHVGSAVRVVSRVGAIAALLAFLLIGAALLLAHDAKMIRRVGRRIALLAIGPTIAFAVLPRILAAGHGNAEAVAAAVLRAYGRRVLLSAVVLVVIGVSTWLIAVAIPILRRRRAVEERAVAGERSGSGARLPGTPISSAPALPLPEKLYL